MDLREIGIDGANWIQLAQGPVAGLCENGDGPSGSMKKAGYFFDKLSDNQLSPPSCVPHVPPNSSSLI
jgi:hypothetical protein